MSLADYWYIAAASREVRDRPVRVEVVDRVLVLWRDQGGKARALEDRCAHRNAALSRGTVAADGTLACAYHGWRYDGGGACRHVPSLGEGRPLPRAGVPGYPVCEQDGYIWVCPGGTPPQQPPFAFPHLGEPGWTSFRMRTWMEGTVESCLENFLDCPHTVFVHRGWFRTHDPRELKAVVRRDAGGVTAEFQDEPVSPSLITRLFYPKNPRLKHTDRFIMPNLSRVDYEFGPDRHFIITSQCTPAGTARVLVHTVITLRFGRIGPLVRLLFEPVSRRIIRQDVAILGHQAGQIARFGGAAFHHAETDLIGPSMQALRAAAGRGEPPPEAPPERIVAIRF